MAILFNGSNNYVRVPSSSSFDFQTKMTIMGWFYMNNLPTGGLREAIMSKQLALGDFRSFIMRVLTATLLYNEIDSQDLTQSPSWTGTTSLSAGVWYHAAFAWEVSAGTGADATVYINGVNDSAIFVANGYNNSFVLGYNASGDVGLGVDEKDTLVSYLDGYLDDVRAYHRRLSDAEIATIYACQGGDGIVADLMARWPMNELGAGITASGSGTVKDLSAVNNGTPTNSPVYAESRLRSIRRIA